ncbi:MAG: hypothetical protein J5826_02145, partial [Bacteroidales bacterium]|nr:hypothetical protein [Bacteroidales bacterium]
VHNPAGTLRLDSVVFCTHCKKSFDFTKSKVIQDNSSNLNMVVCKNYPDCKCTYLDFKVLTPTILYEEAKTEALNKGIQAFPHLTMNSKVHCIHCGEEYIYKDANVVVSDGEEPFVHCKNYPKCDGTIIDMMSIDNRTSKKQPQ